LEHPLSSTHRDVPDLAPPRAEEVSERVYAYIQPDGSWFINNTGFMIGDRGVTSVDACSTERRTRAYLETIGALSDRPVRTLINTHHHGDHTHGNYLFSGATIVAHERCRDEVLAGGLPDFHGIWDDVDWGSLQLAPPFLTYRDTVTVWVDDLACEVRHVGGAAHTTNDSVVWLPERSVLFCGDLLFNQGTPFVLMGSVVGAIEVLDTFVRPLGAKTIVPGHGPVAGPELIDEVTSYLRFVLATATQGIEAGLDPLEAARHADLGEFGGLSDPERIVGNLHRAYAELGGTPRGGSIDLAAALSDMVAYNGGRPLTCRA
jgi:cyclase